MSLNEEELIKARPLVFEARPFGRIKNRCTPLTQSTPPPSLENLHAEIDGDFAYFTGALMKLQLVQNTNIAEVERYAHEKDSILATAESARQTLVSLREELLVAQQEKEYRFEYDGIATGIIDRGLRPRHEQLENLARLNIEIQELERERDEYRRTQTQRKEQFGEIVTRLERMWIQIKEEKDEQDRKEGLSEEEEEGEEVEHPKAASQSGGNTPFVAGELAAVVEKDERLKVPGGTPAVGTPVGAVATPTEEREEGEDEDIDMEAEAVSLVVPHGHDHTDGDKMDTT